MFLTLKRKSIITFSLVLAAIIALAALIPLYSARSASASNGITVVIDAGHGGIDGGVVGSTTLVKESEINLGIAKSLRHLLKKRGFNVVMTRSNQDGLYVKGEGKTKLSDMRKRREIINSAQPDLMISIHQNSYPLKSVSGAQVFFDASSEQSKAYAQSFQSALNDGLNGNRVAKSAEYYVLQCSPYPSVLVECGFLSNPTDEKNLINPAYQEKVAYTLYTAICSALLPSNH